MLRKGFVILLLMDIQNTFYLLGIIFMVLGIFILIGIVVMLFYIKKKIGDIHNFIELRVDELTSLTLKPVKNAADMVRDLLPSSTPKRASRPARKR